MNPIRSRQRILIEQRGPETKRLGFLDIVRYCFLTPVVYLYLAWSWICQNLNILLQETRSLFGRIQVRRKGLNYVPVTRSYSGSLPTQRPFLNSYNQARSACISEMVSNRPWASLVDFQLFLEGWDKGEKWASQEDNRGFYTEQSVAGSYPYAEYTPESPTSTCTAA